MMYGSESTLGSDDEFGEIEFSIANELVKVIAADAALNPWKPPIDFFAILFDNLCVSSLETCHLAGIRGGDFTENPPLP